MCVQQCSRMCVSIYVCNEHLTAKDLKSHESILLMRVLEPERGGIENLSPCSFNLSCPPPFPPSYLPFPSFPPSSCLSSHCFYCSRPTSSLLLSLFFPFLRPASRHQVVVNRAIISSSQMHFASLLHSDKLNIPSKHFFQERRHLVLCFHTSTNLTSDPLD